MNEAEIVETLRHIGVRVFRVSAPGLPDLLTYARGVWLPIEVKIGTGALTPAQREVRAGAPFPVVRSLAEALALFGVTDAD